jgi:hypothetical protein
MKSMRLTCVQQRSVAMTTNVVLVTAIFVMQILLVESVNTEAQ